MKFANLSVPRIVLDTNVCLDLWVFADPGCAAVLAALRSGAVLTGRNTFDYTPVAVLVSVLITFGIMARRVSDEAPVTCTLACESTITAWAVV